MTLRDRDPSGGVDLHLEPEECELFIKLASDAERATYVVSTPTYFSICITIGQRINALRNGLSEHRIA
jgi:hypothetical protein